MRPHLVQDTAHYLSATERTPPFLSQIASHWEPPILNTVTLEKRGLQKDALPNRTSEEYGIGFSLSHASLSLIWLTGALTHPSLLSSTEIVMYKILHPSDKRLPKRSSAKARRAERPPVPIGKEDASASLRLRQLQITDLDPCKQVDAYMYRINHNLPDQCNDLWCFNLSKNCKQDGWMELRGIPLATRLYTKHTPITSAFTSSVYRFKSASGRTWICTKIAIPILTMPGLKDVFT